jgi:integrase
VARAIHRLSARFVATVTAAGYYADGGNLYLQVVGGAKSWILRYTIARKAREMGLGSVALVGLQEARARAVVARRLLAEGVDPIEHRAALRNALGRTWGQASEDFIAARKAEWKNDAQANQWTQSLKDHGPEQALPVTAITTAVVLDCLRPLWKPKDQGGKVETATRVRGRIERIWDAEKVAGHVSGDNPARWKGHLEYLLAKPRKVQPQGHFAAMPYADLPAFMQTLRARDAISRRALEFTILTAARTEEVVGMDWNELHGTARMSPGVVWKIPGDRMKMGVAHEVPLTDAALATLAGLSRKAPPFPLSENGMLFLLQKDLGQPYTVHGFRSAFFDWAHETTGFPKHVIDMALAHAIGDKADAAYRRGALLAKRRELMEAWAAYLA